MWRRIRSLMRALFRPSQVEREMTEEMRFHVEERADHLVREGTARSDALRQASIEFGATEAYKEECRESRIAPWMEELWRNLRYAARSLHRRPGFALIAVLSLALGIGANIAVFSLLDRLVFAELPVRDPKSLYKVMTSRGVIDRLSYPKFERLRDNFDIFESLFGWTVRDLGMTFEDRTRVLHLHNVTGNYFESLGVRPAHGRLLVPEDDRIGSAQAMVLSDRLWREFFGADENVIGRTVKVRDSPFEVVGVAPPDFLGLQPGSPPDAYLTHHAEWRIWPGNEPGEGGMSFFTVGRLKQDVPLEAAATLLRERWPELMVQELGASNYSEPEYLLLKDGSHGFSPLRDEFSRALYALMGLAVAVFLIACANLASLLVVRGIERTGETSMRLALGAGRGQLVGQWMTECLLIAGIGGVTGLLLAYWLTEGLLLFVEESDRAWLRFQADSGTLALGLGLTVGAGLLFGFFPALRASQLGIQALIKEHSTSVVGRRSRFAQAVLCTQIAIALVLVVSAALFTNTLWALAQTPTGLETDTVAWAQPEFWKTDFPRDRVRPVIDEVVERLSNSPNVTSVGEGYGLPFAQGANGWGAITVPGYMPTLNESNLAHFKPVSPGYFETLGIPLVVGRDFQDRDRPKDAPPVAVVNERFARHYFPDQNALGQEFHRDKGAPQRIIGIVGDTIDKSFREEPKELVYIPTGTTAYPPIVVRANAGIDASACEKEIRAALASLAPGVPINSGTLKQAMAESLRRDRLVAQLSSMFGVLGMLLAAVGLYGATAHMARSRRRELGLRIALGAQRSDIVRLMLRENVWVILAGIAAGLAAAFVVGQVIEALLFGVKATDPLALGVSAGLLALVVLAASLLPALRASRVSPLESLRYE